jgi:hypothetical protein
MALDPASIMRRLGIKDPRGLQGALSAGAPVYNGGAPQAQQGGGPQYGRPTEGGMSPPPVAGNNAGPGWNPGSLTDMVGSLPGVGGNQNAGMGSGLNPALLELIKRRLGDMQGYGS